jgi:phage-related protein
MPKLVRQAFGKAILELQRGRFLTMPLSRSMPSVGKGVHELRVRERVGAYRAMYLVKSQKAVYVFHIFQKTSRRAPKVELELARKRMKEFVP